MPDEVYDGTVKVIAYSGVEVTVATVTTSTPATAFKAVYDKTGDANTLTFYYDAVDHSGEGTVYENGTANYLFDDSKSNGAKWGYNSIRSSVKSVKIDSSVADYNSLTSTAFMFQGMTIATNISGAEYLDVSNVTDMSYMFQNFGGGSSGSPTTLNVVPDVSKWNTGNVTNMLAMFESYGNFSSSLDKVPDVSGWNTSNVTDMTFMFQKYGHESQTFNAVPDVSKWDTGNVTNMKQMFYEYGHKSTSLGTVPDVSDWNTGNVTNMKQMFEGYGNTSTNISCVLNLSGWDLSKITGTNVFNFKPSTFNVTIPAKTGEKSNEDEKWYYGDGTNHIAPPAGKSFTPATPTISTIGDIIHTLDSFPTSYATSNWKNSNDVRVYVESGYMLCFEKSEGSGYLVLPASMYATATGEGDIWTAKDFDNNSITFTLENGVLKSITLPELFGQYPTFSGTYAPAVSTMLTLGVSGDQTHDAPMTEAEANVPFAEKFEPEFEPEKFEEAKPEELIEPTEAVAEEAAP